MKQVIVMRKDLNMRKGKMVAQGGHAALGALIGDISVESLSEFHPNLVMNVHVYEWLRTGMKKVCVGIDSEHALMELVHRAKQAGIPAYTVRDAGHTELEPGTITCAGIGPARDELIDEITGHLKLL